MNKRTKIIISAMLLFCIGICINIAFVTVQTNAASLTDQAIKIEHDTLLDGVKYSIGDSYAVSEDSIYNVSAYIRSQNATAQTDIRIDIEVFNSSNVKIAEITGKNYPLNTQSELSEPIKSVNKPIMPSGASYIKLYAYLTQGRATAYIDGINVYNVEENNQIIVEKLDFSKAENGWMFEKSGSSTITDVTKGLKINVKRGTARLSKRITTLQSDVTYTVSTGYSSSVNFNFGISFYDIRGGIIGESIETKVNNSANNVATLTFTAQSHYYAVLYYNITTAGEINLLSGDIKEIANGNMLRQAAQWNMRGIGEITTEKSISGYSIKMDITDSSTKPYVICSDAVRLAQGKKYKFSYYVKAENTSGIEFRAFLDLTNSDDGWVEHAGKVVDKNCDWEKREYEFQVSKTSQLSGFGFQFLEGRGTVYIDEVTISCGDVGSIFAPCKASVSAVQKLTAQPGAIKEFTTELILSSEIKRDFIPRAKIKKDGKTVTGVSLDFSKPVSELVVGKNYISISFVVPTFLKNGSYKLCLSSSQFIGSIDVILAEIVIDTESTMALPNCEVQVINGMPTIVIDGKPQSAIMYQKPYGTGFLQDGDESIFNSGINLYVTYKGGLGVNSIIKNKGGVGMNDDLWQPNGSLNFTAFDEEINATLSADADCMVMVNIGIYAPQWWLDANSSEACVISNAVGEFTTINDASFASDRFISEASEKLRRIIQHMTEQPYYSRVFGIKLSAGRTNEWMSYGENGDYCDYSTAALKGFRKYLKEKYIEISKLRAAWGSSSVTFENATIPTIAERGQSSLGMLISEQRVIDYNTFVGYASANALIKYAKVVKENTPNNLLVGGYNGYLWFSNGHDGLTSSHTSLERVLKSEYIDFIASPANYNEKTLGRSSGVMSVSDSVRAYGKLYIVEEDNRTSYAQGYSNVGWNAQEINSIGRTYSATETINLAKRDWAYNFVNGNGQWLFDMEGGWFNDEQFYSLVNDMKKESDYSLKTSTDLNNEVAVFVPDNLYSYATVNNGDSNPYYLYQYLYREQRKNLNAAGAGYDVYSISSIKGELPEYKVNIMLAPISLTDEERNAIDEKFKKDGKFIVWVYLADYSHNGSEQMSKMSQTVGMTIKNDKVNGKKFAVKFSGSDPLVAGLSDSYFGSSGTVRNTLPYVTDSSVTKLGYLADYSSSVSKRVGLAYKDNQTYKTIFSSVPNLPEAFLRNIYAAAGVHIYSNNSCDVIWNNSSYIALHSGYSGEKTIVLNGDYSVYDVFSKNYISLNTSTITYNHIGDDTKLFRLSKPINQTETDTPKVNEDENGGKIGCSVSVQTGSIMCWMLALGVALLFKKKKE